MKQTSKKMHKFLKLGIFSAGAVLGVSTTAIELRGQSCATEKDFNDFAQEITLTPVWSQLRFTQAVAGLQIKMDAANWYVVQQDGKILRVPKRSDASAKYVAVFMNISDRVLNSNELGLLSFAFSPNYAQDRKVYAFYSAIKHSPFMTRLSRFTVNSDFSTVDPTSEEILLSYNKPFENHNGGTINFGKDGYLYISTGDGGSGGDPQNHAQNLQSWLGKMQRIDVSGKANGKPYLIPTDNPFARGTNALPEIYAYGLRNPWRWSFDSVTGKGWVADVGQDKFEEINVLASGANYGWKQKEAFACYATNPCNLSTLTDPIWAYGRNEGSSITGGYVYHGNSLKGLACSYIYGDFATGKIWALRQDPLSKVVNNKLLINSELMISSFAEGLDGEILAIQYGGDGKIYKIGL